MNRFALILLFGTAALLALSNAAPSDYNVDTSVSEDTSDSENAEESTKSSTENVEGNARKINTEKVSDPVSEEESHEGELITSGSVERKKRESWSLARQQQPQQSSESQEEGGPPAGLLGQTHEQKSSSEESTEHQDTSVDP